MWCTLLLIVALVVLLADGSLASNAIGDEPLLDVMNDRPKIKEEFEEGSGEIAVLQEVSNSTTTTTTKAPIPIRCFDQSVRCPKIKKLCNNLQYKIMMTRACAKTCGMCHEFVRMSKIERCRDSWTRCPAWAKNGFCHSSYYTIEERSVYCTKSCGLCS
ncbi:unnamed protein product [Caenorhabditis bovis]|uniref:ShKT domain-containing protein n=1 Tax=Caenorhabditis bovis TaxID=2654633 RepID=A0A8S1FAW7_9PELO|nr:unnamed protein product [Caenorhabditis bovis]